MDLIAITTIQRAEKPGKEATQTTRAVPPKTETIPVGASFTASPDEADELIRMGAARKDPAKAKTQAKAKTPAKKTNDGEPKAPDEMTVPEIKAELDGLEVEYASDALKDDLVKVLTDARSASLV